MTPFDADELAALQSAQEDAMQDTCILQRYGEISDEYNNPRPLWSDEAEETACGFWHIRPDEAMGEGQVAVFDARLRLPLATTIDPRDRVKLTHSFGVALSAAEVYEIVGQPRRGPSGLVLDLHKNTGGNYG